MRILFGFVVGVLSSKYLLAHVAFHVIAWHPFAVSLALK